MCSFPWSWFGFVGQVHNHLGLAEQYSLRNGKNIAFGRVQGHYRGNGDRILTFETEKGI